MNTSVFFQPLDGPIPTLKRVFVILWKSGTVRLFFRIALFFVIPATAILLAFVYTALHHHHNADDDPNGSSNFWKNMKYYAAVLGSKTLIHQTLGAIAEAAISVAVADLYLQRQPRWFSCLQKASTKAITLLIAGILAGMSILFGYLFFIIPGWFFRINFMLVTPVIVLEDEFSVLSSLGRSWDLTKGHRFYILQCLLGLEFLYWIVNEMLKSFLSSSSSGGGEVDSRPYFSLTFHLLAAIPNSIFVPALGILKTVLYIQIMMVNEGFTEDRLASQVDGFTGGGGGYSVPLVMEHHDLEFSYENLPTQEIQTTIPELDMLHPPATTIEQYAIE